MRACRLSSFAPLAVLVTLLGLGCATGTATVPPVRRGIDTPSRLALYEEFKLSPGRRRFPTWTRRDGEYDFAALDRVLDAYPETRALREHVRRRRLVVGALGGTGTAIIAGTLVYGLATPAHDAMPVPAQTTLYVTGAGLVLTGILMQLAWHDPAEDLADVYDRALATDLGLAPGTRQVYHSSSLGPRLVIAPAPIAGSRGIAPGVGAQLAF